jgi:predicted aconitase with swiveling domain
MLRDLTLVQLLENACTAGILFIVAALMLYFGLVWYFVGDIRDGVDEGHGRGVVGVVGVIETSRGSLE